MPKVLSILLSALFTAASCWAAGSILLARCRVTFYAGELQYFRFVSGGACLSLLVFCLTAANLARDWVFLIAGLALIAGAIRIGARQQSSPVPLPDYPNPWKISFWAVFGVYGVYYLVNAVAPEVSSDGSGYHLGLVSRYLRWHSFGHITTDMYANLSQGLEMLFLFAFAFGRHSAAALVEFWFLLALPIGMLFYARRFGFPRAGVFGALLVFVSPVVGMSGTVAYNDAAGVCVLFAVFYLLQIWAVTRERDLVFLIGLLAGFCYAIKYTLFLAAPFAGCFLIWKMAGARRFAWKPAGLFAAGACLMICPWMLKNWVIVANPFSPFLNQLFPNPYVTIGFEEGYAQSLRVQDNLKPGERPLEQTVQGGRTAGLVGPIFLLAPLALLALRFPAGRQLLLAGAVFLLPAFANLQTRFLMPCLPFVSLAMGLALMEARGALWLLLIFDTITCWPSFTGNYCTSYAWRLTEFPVAEAVRKVSEITTLRKRIEWMPVAELIEQKVPRGGRVLTFSDPPEAYTTRDIVIAYESAYGQKLKDILYCAAIAEYRPTRILTFAFPERTVQRIRVVQTAKQGSENWSVAEFRVLRAGAEVKRSPQWRISAEPNPFDVAMAFDNDPVTRWSSEQALYAGMRLGVDFGKPLKADAVELQCSHDQGSIRLRVDEEVTPGVWRTLSSDATGTNRDSGWNLRRAAMLEVRSRGVTHLLVGAGDFAAGDFERNAGAWGLSQEGTAADARLYRLTP